MRETGGHQEQASAGLDPDYAWFRTLFCAYHSIMVTAAYNRLSNRADAEDAAGEVFRIVWSRRDSLRGGPSLAWLYSTLRYVVGNEYRRRERAERRSIRAQEATEGPVPQAEDQGDRIEVRRIVALLDQPDRELIWMAYWEELTREEMAEVLGCSPSAARVRLHRARGRLEVLLVQHLGQEIGGGYDARR